MSYYAWYRGTLRSLLAIILLGMIAACGSTNPTSSSATRLPTVSTSVSAITSMHESVPEPPSSHPAAAPASSPNSPVGAAVSTATALPEPASPTLQPTKLASAEESSPLPSATSEPTALLAGTLENQAGDQAGEVAQSSNPDPAAANIAEVSSADLQEASPPVRIVIKDIALDRKLVSVGLDKKRVPIVPKHDIGWYNLSAMPGQGENVVLWGHVLRFKKTPKIPAPFARLKELKLGTTIQLYNKAGQTFTYIVTEQIWVTPDKVEYILPLGEERLTMVSCIGDKVVTEAGVELTHRLITIAKPAP